MTRIQLRIYINPGEAECSLRVKRKDGDFEELTAIVDTGAQISLFPIGLLNIIQYDEASANTVVIDQAGVAGQRFEAIEAKVTVYLEDSFGARTEEMDIRAWFAEGDNALLGFDGILERAIFFLDMPNLRGYLEL